MLVLCPQNAEDVPVAFEHVFKQEADAAIANLHGGGRPFVDIHAVKKVALKLLLADEIGGFSAKFG